ncbi:MAG: TetR/AcrR family transcriptional regulator [Bacteroidales bacterium]
MMDEKHQDYLLRVYDLYNRYGIRSVTMDDVARELGISKKTLYESVKDKADLVEQVMFHNQQNNVKKVNSLTSPEINAIEELFLVNYYMNQMMKEQNPSVGYDLRKYYSAIFEQLLARQRESMHNAIRVNLEKGVREGLYRDNMNIGLISKIHLTRLEYRHSTDPYMISDLNSEEVMREIFIYHIHGIASEKGIKELYKQIKKYWK